MTFALGVTLLAVALGVAAPQTSEAPTGAEVNPDHTKLRIVRQNVIASVPFQELRLLPRTKEFEPSR